MPASRLAANRDHFARELPGFRWLVEARLGGMARPGLVSEVGDDLAALAGLGVKALVCLEPCATDHHLVGEYGIQLDHLPIPEMGAPRLEAALPLLRRTRERSARGVATVFHCKGGLGRTNTLLAGQLVFEGARMDEAIDRVRDRSMIYEPLDAELMFLARLQRHVDAVSSP